MHGGSYSRFRVTELATPLQASPVQGQLSPSPIPRASTSHSSLLFDRPPPQKLVHSSRKRKENCPPDKPPPPKRYYADRWTAEEKMEHVLDAIFDCDWSFGDFLYNFFSTADVNGRPIARSRSHASALGKFLKGGSLVGGR